MKPVPCEFALSRISAYVDGDLPSSEALTVRAHAHSCTLCSRRLEELQTTRRAIRTLPKLRVPATVTTSLRVIASRERTRQVRWRSFAAFAAGLRADTALLFNNLMKPFAIPVAGGITTATLAFSMIVSSYPLGGRTLDRDVPAPIYTAAVFKGMVPFEFARHDVILDLIIDDQGRVLDYQIAGGSKANDPAVRRSVENIILFTEFQPATAFGQRVRGRVRISFQTGLIEVRG